MLPIKRTGRHCATECVPQALRACFCSALHTPQHGLLRDDGGDAAGVLRGQAGGRGGEAADGGPARPAVQRRRARVPSCQQAALTALPPKISPAPVVSTGRTPRRGYAARLPRRSAGRQPFGPQVTIARADADSPPAGGAAPSSGRAAPEKAHLLVADLDDIGLLAGPRAICVLAWPRHPATGAGGGSGQS